MYQKHLKVMILHYQQLKNTKVRPKGKKTFGEGRIKIARMGKKVANKRDQIQQFRCKIHTRGPVEILLHFFFERITLAGAKDVTIP
jgi:hypothetical protein